MKEKQRYVMTMIAVCGLVGASLGINLGSSGLFYNAISADLGITKASISMTYTIAAMAAAVSGLFIARILKNEKNLKPMILTGVILSAAGMILMTTTSSVFVMYLLSVVRGLGAGLLSFVMATNVINQWFLARNGIMVSVAMAFSGLPGVLLSGMFSSVIDAKGWRYGYLFVAAVMILFTLPAVIYPIRLKPSQVQMKPYGYEEYMEYRKNHPEKAIVSQSDQHIEHHSEAMILMMLMTVMVYIIASFLQHLPSFAASVGLSTAAGALMVSFASAANITSKIVYGAANEKIGPFRTSIIYAGISALALCVMIFIHQPFIMACASFVFGFTFANSSTAISIMVREVFGMENYTRVYPLMSFAGSASNALGVSLLGFMYDVSGSYYIILIMCILMQAATILCTMRLSGRKA